MIGLIRLIRRIWSAAASGIPRDAASARAGSGKRCRDPRTARLLSPHSKLRFAQTGASAAVSANPLYRRGKPLNVQVSALQLDKRNKKQVVSHTKGTKVFLGALRSAAVRPQTN
jgi:hypothetical protein